jgi:outer membrane receptor for ferrienterochelin and colicin
MSTAKIFSLSVFLSVIAGFSAYTQTISGFVRDSETREPLTGCTIYEPFQKKGVASNASGFYSLTFTADKVVQLNISYIGYAEEILKLKLTNDTVIDIYLTQDNTIKEITILSDNAKHTGNRISINSRHIRLLPTLGGESDLIKVMQLTPGIQQGREGSSDIFVRGGSPDQNLILLDGVPVYYINHLGGFVSVFNPDMIQSATLIKGGFPSYYGSRLSSVIDIKTTDGNFKKFEGTATLGLLSSKLFLQGPLIKNKLSVSVSARRFMYDLFSVPFSKLIFDNYTFAYNFYDINAKVNYKINPKTTVDFSFYTGDDKLKFAYNSNELKGKNNFKWGNYTYSLRLKKVVSKNIFLKVLAANSDYHYSRSDGYQTSDLTSNNELYCNINDYILKLGADIYIQDNILLQTGVESVFHEFEPGVSSFFTSYNDSILDNRHYNLYNSTALETAIYLQSKMKFWKKINTDIGIRLTRFDAKDTVFYAAEPRLNISYSLQKLSLLFSYSQMHQYIHLLSGSGIVMPTDFWVPSDKDVLPQNSKLYTTGFENLSVSPFKLSSTIYYKTFDRLIEYQEGVNSVNGLNDWKKITDKNGSGHAYGAEILLRYKTKRIDSWLSYTYSRNFRKFEEQNNGLKYPYKYDKPHNLILTGIYQINKKYSFSASWVFYSGRPMTIATNIYKTPTDFEDGLINFVNAELYTPKNSYRMKPYHRLDLSLNIKKVKKRGTVDWNFSIYNVYSRQNAYYYYYDYEQTLDDSGTFVISEHKKLYQMSFFPIIPSFSYSFQF